MKNKRRRGGGQFSKDLPYRNKGTVESKAKNSAGKDQDNSPP